MIQNKYSLLLTILFITSSQTAHGWGYSSSGDGTSTNSEASNHEQNPEIDNPNKINQNKLKTISQENMQQHDSGQNYQQNQNGPTTQNSSWWKPTLQRTSSNASTSSLSSTDSSVDLSSLNNQSSPAPASRSNSWTSNFSFRSNKATAQPITDQALSAKQPIEVVPASKPVQEPVPTLDPKLIKNVRTNMITRANPQVQLTPEQTRVLQDPTTTTKYNIQDKTMSYKLSNNQIDVNQNDKIVKTITTTSNLNDSSSTIEKNYTTGDVTTTNKDATGNITSIETTRVVTVKGLPSWTETTTMNADGKTIQKKVTQTDGSYQIMTYDPNIQNGNSRSILPQTETSYDNQGTKISLRNNKPDGSYSITDYDPNDPNKVIGKRAYNANGTQTIGSQIKSNYAHYMPI